MVRVGTAIFGPRPPRRGRSGRMSVKGKRVGFIGGGNMGEALIKGLARARPRAAGAIAATDVQRRPRSSQLDPAVRHHAPTATTRARARGRRGHPGRQAADHGARCCARSRPPSTPREAPDLDRRRRVHRHASASGLGKDARLIRVMPNTPALVLRGRHRHRAGGRGSSPAISSTARGDLRRGRPRRRARRGADGRGHRALAAPAPPTWPS